MKVIDILLLSLRIIVIFDGAVDAGDNTIQNNNNERSLSNCWNSEDPPPAWHPVYSAGWTNGYCQYTIDCDSPSYTTELDCCKGSYMNQLGNNCIKNLNSPPTLSPTDTDGPDEYYPDYSMPWDQGYCINKRPIPLTITGWGTYSSELDCCKSAYAGQLSGKCISMLQSPPTTSPTSSDRTASFWYPYYESAWSHATCRNTLPLPYKYINDRPNYSTAKECCKIAYAGQMSKSCICSITNPPTKCPNVIQYEVTTITSVISSTLNLGSITVSSDVTERTELKEDLESVIFDMLRETLGDGLQQVVILSIDGVPFRRELHNIVEDSRALSTGITSIEFEAIVNTECTTDCETDNVVGNSVREVIVEEMSDTAAVENAVQSSGNEVLASSTVEGIIVSTDVVTTSTTETVTGPAVPNLSNPPPTSQLISSPTMLPTRPPTISPMTPPTQSPTTSAILTDQWMYAGNEVSFPSENEVVLQSSDYTNFGVVLTTHSYNDDDVDFQVTYTQTSFADVQGGYESQLYIFLVEEGTYAESLMQKDDVIGEFLDMTVGYIKSKVHTTIDSTWFHASTGDASLSTKYLELNLRIRRLNNQIYTYYKLPNDDMWIDIGEATIIPQELQAVPVQFGMRIKKEWKAYHNFSVTASKISGGSPLTIPSRPTQAPTTSPIQAPGTGPLTQDQLMFDGNGVSFPSNTEVVLQSNSSASSEVGVVITKHAFNDADVDFAVHYTQTSFADVQTGYQSHLVIFFAEEGTYPDTLLQSDNDFGEFEDFTVGWVKSKIFVNQDGSSAANTWFSSATAEPNTSRSTTASANYMDLSLRIRRLDNVIYAYYKVQEGDWTSIGEAMNIPQDMHDVPLQFGFRVKKEYQANHHFSIAPTKISGGTPLPIPTKAPSSSPTETRTYIVPGTVSKEPVCQTTLDRSSVSGYAYEVRGIGGGGAMSGLSISPWNDLWFVGTDMGTLFRSSDAGFIWYPVSHYEAKYHSRLIVSAPVGFTSDPDIVVHATCHELVDTRNCVAQRSIDSGITWSPIDITGGLRKDNQDNPVLDEIPMSWYGSLTQNSGIIYCITYNSGIVYKSSDDGATWSSLSLPFVDTTNLAVGLYFDESAAPTRYIYFATTHSIYMWKEGYEASAREIYSTDGTILLQSFTGARTGNTLMLSFVDTDISACLGDVDDYCGFVHTFYSTLDTTSAETFSFAFTKTDKSGHRVASSRTDSDLIYVTGARGWPSATGTKVWVGSYDSDQDTFVFTLKFRQYPLWDSDKLDYSGVGLDVGYWDGGYYRWNVKPNDSSVAGGSGNFFLHITRDGGENWESPFTEYADGCNTNGERLEGRRWRSTGLEMTSVRFLKFNPYNTNYAYASVADIRQLRSDDGGNTFQITGGDNTEPLFNLNTVYDYAFAGVHTVFAVGGNFHDWPHEWYKNLRRGAGGVFVSFNSGDNWHTVGAEASRNCDDDFLNVDCSLGDDMVRQILSVHWDATVGGGTLYIGSQSAGVARLAGLNDIMESGTIEQMQALQWEWINTGLGTSTERIIPEIKQRNGKMYCLLTGNAPNFSNNAQVGIYEFDHASDRWSIKKGVINRHSSIEARFNLWDYPTSFDIDENGNMFLVDIETNGNYLASGIWKSADDGDTWDRVQQFTHPYHILCVGNRIYASGARSISHIGHAGWGDGGAFYSDDGGVSWQKNEGLPLLSNLNSVTVDPADETKVFYTFFGGGIMHGPKPVWEES